MDMIRVQMRCHTKAIIVDPPDPENPDSGEVLFGSHNLTNTGALFNRDASLVVRDAEVSGRVHGQLRVNVSTGLVHRIEMNIQLDIPALAIDFDGKVEKLHVLSLMKMSLDRDP